MHLMIFENADKKRVRLQLDKIDDAGQVVASTIQYFDADAHYKVAAGMLGLKPNDLQKYVRDYRTQGIFRVELATVESPASSATLASTKPVNVFLVRDIASSETKPYQTFQEAIQNATLGNVIEWSDISNLCAMDLDFHSMDSPSDLLRFVMCIRPAPVAYWITRNAGLRLIYPALGRYTGEELAAIAAWQCAERYPQGKIELLTRTRYPASEIHWQTPTDDIGKLGRLSTVEGDNSEFANYLEENDYEIGQRYSHDRCPVRPSERAKGNTNPIVIHSHYVKCYICEADGIPSRSPGYFSASFLLGNSVRSGFGECVRRFTHWDHAKIVLSGLFNSERLARIIYQAALKAYHKDDPRLSYVFTSGQNLIRFQGYWGDSNGKGLVFKTSCPATLRILPACMYIDEEGNKGIDLELVERFTQTTDLTQYGYPPVSTVHGYEVSFQTQGNSNRHVLLLHSDKLPDPDSRPKYIQPKERITLDDAFAELYKPFPGLNRNAVLLLLAAKGITEIGSGVPPMLFFEGVTGAGKTSTCEIVAAMCGDSISGVSYYRDDLKILQSIVQAKQNGSFALMDEYLKKAGENKVSASSAMQLVLHTQKTTLVHKLYTGALPIGVLPVLIFADSKIPSEVEEHAQVARRLVRIKLHGFVDWKNSKAKYGIASNDDIRRNPAFRNAIDSILSCVSDTYFYDGSMPLFDEIARELGFDTLENSSGRRETNVVIKAFFDAICKLPDTINPETMRLEGKHWKRLDLNSNTEAMELWKQLHNEGNPYQATRVDECHLKEVCKLHSVASMFTRRGNNVIYIRFADAGERFTNLELVTDIREASIHGHGNPIGLQSEDGGGESISNAHIDAIDVMRIHASQSAFGMG